MGYNSGQIETEIEKHHLELWFLWYLFLAVVFSCLFAYAGYSMLVVHGPELLDFVIFESVMTSTFAGITVFMLTFMTVLEILGMGISVLVLVVLLEKFKILHCEFRRVS